MNWKNANLYFGLAVCMFFLIMMISGTKSPFGDMFKSFGSSTSGGRGGSGIYFGGGK